MFSVRVVLSLKIFWTSFDENDLLINGLVCSLVPFFFFPLISPIFYLIYLRFVLVSLFLGSRSSVPFVSPVRLIAVCGDCPWANSEMVWVLVYTWWGLPHTSSSWNPNPTTALPTTTAVLRGPPCTCRHPGLHESYLYHALLARMYTQTCCFRNQGTFVLFASTMRVTPRPRLPTHTHSSEVLFLTTYVVA